MTVPASQPDDAAWQRTFLLQLVVALLSVIAIQATRPMVTYRAIGLGAGPAEIGLVQSSFSLLPAITAVALGRWVDRVGEARFLVVGIAMISGGALVVTIAGSLPVLALGLTIMGFGQITNLIAGQAMIANRGPRDGREQRFAWYSTVASLGQLAGPAIAAVLVGTAVGAAIGGAPGVDGPPSPLAGLFPDNPEAPVFVFSTVAAGVACLLAFGLPHHRPRRAAPEPDAPSLGLIAATRRVVRRPGMTPAMLVSITVVSCIDVLVAYLPAYGELSGLSVETVGLLLSVRASASLVSRLFMARLIALLGREMLLAASMGLAGAAFVLLPFVTDAPILFVLMALIGLGLGLGQPMTIAWVANRSPREERALALGVRLTGNRTALLVVPTVMGTIAGATGLAAIWLLLAGVLGAGAFVASRTPFDELVERRAAGRAAEPAEPAGLAGPPDPT